MARAVMAMQVFHVVIDYIHCGSREQAGDLVPFSEVTAIERYGIVKVKLCFCHARAQDHRKLSYFRQR